MTIQYIKINKYIITLNEIDEINEIDKIKNKKNNKKNNKKYMQIINVEDFTNNSIKQDLPNFTIGTIINNIDKYKLFNTKEKAFYYKFVDKHEYLFFENGYSGLQIDDDDDFICKYYHINGKKEGKYTKYRKKNPEKKISEELILEEEYINDELIDRKNYLNNILTVHERLINNKMLSTAYKLSNQNIIKIKEYEYDFESGNLDGIYTKYYDNGNIKTEVNYINSKKNGIYREYDETGQLLTEITYINDKINGECKSYYDTNKILSICNYKNDFLNGQNIKYYQNGNIEYKCNYINGCLDGVYEYYYINNKLKFICNYKYDEKTKIQKNLHGEYIQFDENGNICKKMQLH
jgi:antitoxin component YwqK of YwqJK toxin-antitoxin module